MIITILLSAICISQYDYAYAATVKINKKSADVIKGNYLYLKITGAKSKIKWSSSNEYVATVNSKGRVKSIKVGNATISAKIGSKKYNCKVTVVPKPSKDYITDIELETKIAERDYIDKIASDTVLVPEPNNSNTNKDKKKKKEQEISDDTLKKMIKYGFSTSEEMNTESGKAYIDFCDSWIGDSELKYSYGISVIHSFNDNLLYILIDIDNKYIIENAPTNFISGEIYTNNAVRYQYLKEFEYGGHSYYQEQFFFYREDLIKLGIIK